jgi:protein-S-isoprenylcysteine O-methyltransferase Ste14
MQTFDRIFGSGPRIHLTILSLAVIIYLLRAKFSWAALVPDEGSLLTLAIVMLACWIIVWIWALGSLGRKIGLQVLQSGPYRFVRHPMYSTEMFFGWAIILFILNTWLAIPAFLLTLLLANSFVRYEEEMMEEQFGDDWKAYAKKTSRFFPRPSRKHA